MEKYLAIIKVLDNWDSITQEQIMHKAEVKLVPQKEALNFLVKLDLLEEKKVGTKTVYSITFKGQRLSIYFRLNDHSAIFGETKITRID
jgi:predicted transcriptional regulator